MNKKKYLLIILVLVGMLFLTGCGRNDVTNPIPEKLFTNFKFEDIFIYPMAGIMWLVSKTIAFGSYGLVIIFATIIVRSMAWPIYAKTNDLSLKMSLVQPEIDKIDRKYAGKDDQQSQQRMQMEKMQIYKKYGIGLGGCLTPLIQMPIFIGFYRTISRMPTTVLNKTPSGELIYGSFNNTHWLSVFDTSNFLGIDLLKTRTGGWSIGSWTLQDWGVVILALLVGLTQIFSIYLSQKRTKKMQAEKTSTVPSYRLQQQTDAQRQTQNTMNIMLYGMAVMMVIFVLQSPAGLGLYWLVGNLFSTLQSYIGSATSAKRLEVLRQKH